ncbi:unnamed protein product [Pleuronectes platessa]|uniref:Link domain-containing protein n=1 Tax=Pleuronectes platessa TaxID=8262 RepID=A0A9N7V4X8_PLEPL|nr:unnamed protein product [Pleuronectes platessa]
MPLYLDVISLLLINENGGTSLSFSSLTLAAADREGSGFIITAWVVMMVMMMMMMLMMKICWLMLGAQLALAAPTVPNKFSYYDLLGGNDNKETPVGGVRIHVAPAQAAVFAAKGQNVTLPCRFWYEPELSSPRNVRIKWSWLPAAGGPETDVLVAISSRTRSFGAFRTRDGTAVKWWTGLEDKSTSVDLELQGVVFPYQHHQGRYQLSFLGAQRACEEQDSSIATFTQLLQSWKEGLNWCNAGWLADGTVQYPITRPRGSCGGQDLAPGVRSYGRGHLLPHHYDVFCFSSSLRGRVYYLQPFHKMSLPEARQACQADGAEVAKVGQLYAAWEVHRVGPL